MLSVSASTLIGVAFCAVVEAQLSLSTLGSGLLDPSYLRPGGLHFPNADGSGPRANSLAAAIYGVAIPPGFGDFAGAHSASGPQPSDLLIGTGLHTTGRYGSFGTDLSGSASGRIDGVAALFGQVIGEGDHPGFHPLLTGAQESSSSSSFSSTSTGVPPVATTAPADLDGFSSPVAVSLSYNLPNFVDLSDSYGGGAAAAGAPVLGVGEVFQFSDIQLKNTALNLKAQSVAQLDQSEALQLTGAEEKSTGLETAGQSAVSKTADIKSEKSVDPYLVNKSRTSGPAAATRSNARPVVAFFPSDFTSQKV